MNGSQCKALTRISVQTCVCVCVCVCEMAFWISEQTVTARGEILNIKLFLWGILYLKCLTLLETSILFILVCWTCPQECVGMFTMFNQHLYCSYSVKILQSIEKNA